MTGFKYDTGGAGSAAFEVTGIERLRRVSAILGEIDDKALKREYSKAIREATKPLVLKLRQSAIDTLPKSGGLNVRVSKTRISTSITSGPRNAGVRLRDPGGRNAKDVRKINEGSVRHPLYGNRKHWYTQPVEPGWWDKPLEDPALKAEIGARIERAVGDFIQRRLG